MKIIKKIKEVYRRQVFVQSSDSWSLHRFFVFFFSIKGQKRIFKFMGKVIRYLWRMVFGGQQIDELTYTKWRKKNSPDKKELQTLLEEVDTLKNKPLISIVMPVYQPNLQYLNEAVLSVQNQLYQNWELCIADDCSNDSKLKKYLNQLTADDKRVKVIIRKENGHISACTNSALELATGEYIGFMDQDDLLATEALASFILSIDKNPNAEILYSDEDKVTENKRHIQPHFKPDWSPDNFLSRNYIGHLVLMKHNLIKQLGGFRMGFEGSQDFDLLLRATEKSKEIVHIPKILYHWRMHNLSTSSNEGAKNYAFDSGIKALNEALIRRGISGKVRLQTNKPGFYTIDYALNTHPKISILIPTKDNAKVLSTCLHSVFEKSSYRDFEVIILDNRSETAELKELVNEFKNKFPNQFKVVKCNYQFNFSKLMNDGVKNSEGEYLLLLNNDTEVLQENWMELMMQHAQRVEVGAVGVKLLFPNDTIQHAGVVIGMGGVAGHTFIGLERDEPGYFYYLTSVSNYSAVTAACLLVSKDKFNEVNGFDEKLAIEYNDVDFCLKLREKGYLNVFVPDVELYHYESLTRGHPHATRESYKRHLKEVAYFKGKWQNYIDNDPHYNPNLSRISTHFEPNVIG